MGKLAGAVPTSGLRVHITIFYWHSAAEVLYSTFDFGRTWRHKPQPARVFVGKLIVVRKVCLREEPFKVSAYRQQHKCSVLIQFFIELFVSSYILSTLRLILFYITAVSFNQLHALHLNFIVI